MNLWKKTISACKSPPNKNVWSLVRTIFHSVHVYFKLRSDYVYHIYTMFLSFGGHGILWSAYDKNLEHFPSRKCIISLNRVQDSLMMISGRHVGVFKIKFFCGCNGSAIKRVWYSYAFLEGCVDGLVFVFQSNISLREWCTIFTRIWNSIPRCTHLSEIVWISLGVKGNILGSTLCQLMETIV